jgi:light-regulated signal transduction histidine kinase (bacteriophytochrome)
MPRNNPERASITLVQELFHAHGNVQVHSREGEGSTFLVTVRSTALDI